MQKCKNNTVKNGTIRIISGLHRGRKLPVLDSEGLRPTTDRVKETIFNWLMFKIADLRVLDAFSGSGSLGFEAVSRGASHVTMLEKNEQVYRQLTANVNTLKCSNVSVIKTDTIDFLATCNQSFDLIFLDPPFRTGLLEKSVDLLTPTIAPPGCLIYIEHESENTLELPARYNLLKSGHAGQVIYSLYEVN